MTDVRRRRLLFAMFFGSGFCGLLYQVVWLRLAFASFGITTAVLSVVVSVFMLGLGAGAWIAGRVLPRWQRTGRSPLTLYAIIEAGIATGCVAVPALFHAGEAALLRAGAADSASYHLASGLLLAATMLPWCTLMGATFPLVMAYVRDTEPGRSASSFSFLYLANVIGAAAGTLGTAVVLVELFGFSPTLLVAGAVNLAIAVVAVTMAPARTAPRADTATPASPDDASRRNAPAARGGSLAMWTLFTTGFCSMGFEVVWTRSYTPILHTYVYSFASLLAVYLVATFAGSWKYRRDLAAGRTLDLPVLLGVLAVAAVFPLWTSDPRVVGIAANVIAPTALVLLGIVPFSATLGYLTPQLIDRASGGDPAIAGRAYAVNVAGCIAGPLAVSYLLLPSAGARWALLALVVPFAALYAASLRGTPVRRLHIALGTAGVALAGTAAGVLRSFEEGGAVKGRYEIRRDHTATVISHGEGMGRKMLVNGVGITALDRCTKFMAHLPLAARPDAESALVICFGMGTTYRSLLSWGVDTTAVELVPSVRDAFPFYFDDAAELLAHPKGRVVIDDGRRFLQRTDRTFDVVTLDPPPPVEAAGSSLLYTNEFYRLVKLRLATGGILHAWFPGMPKDDGTYGAVLRSLADEFPHIRVFTSTKDRSYHYLCSLEPLVVPDAEAFLARMPEAARRDLVEWNTGEERDPLTYIRSLLAKEVPVGPMLAAAGENRITDDRPFNEYYVLRRKLGSR